MAIGITGERSANGPGITSHKIVFRIKLGLVADVGFSYISLNQPLRTCYLLTSPIPTPWGHGRLPMTQTKLTSERFIQMVTKSGLVDNEALERLLENVRSKLGGDLPENPRKLASVFKKEGLLTDWHIEKLLGGKYKGFFLGKYKLLGHIGTGGMSSVYLAEHRERPHCREVVLQFLGSRG